MAAKKKVITPEFAQPEAQDHSEETNLTDIAPAKVVARPEAGTIIKTYIQNGHRYNRVVNEAGGTDDFRVA